jgi:hypothetical protein
MVMGRPCFPAPDVHRAAQDVAYFDEQLGHFGDRYRERAAFIDAVLAAWQAGQPRDDEPTPAPALSYVERRVLAFAAEKLPRFRKPGSAEQAIRWEFGFSATRYHQILNSLIDRPEALAFAPNTVNRLRARRAHRRLAGCAPSLGRAA